MLYQQLHVGPSISTYTYNQINSYLAYRSSTVHRLLQAMATGKSIIDRLDQLRPHRCPICWSHANTVTNVSDVKHRKYTLCGQTGRLTEEVLECCLSAERSFHLPFHPARSTTTHVPGETVRIFFSFSPASLGSSHPTEHFVLRQTSILSRVSSCL
jgi:hypothetical protein